MCCACDSHESCKVSPKRTLKQHMRQNHAHRPLNEKEPSASTASVSTALHFFMMQDGNRKLHTCSAEPIFCPGLRMTSHRLYMDCRDTNKNIRALAHHESRSLITESSIHLYVARVGSRHHIAGYLSGRTSSTYIVCQHRSRHKTPRPCRGSVQKNAQAHIHIRRQLQMARESYVPRVYLKVSH